MSSTGDSGAGEVGAIVGPTAAGKSAVAMWLAGQRDIAIISADSRQLYRGFDVGTAKPTRAEQERVPHFGIDIADPTQRFSAFAWAEDAARWIAEARESGRTPLIVGGTGLYIRALAEPGFVEPPLDEERRERVQGVLGTIRTGELRRWVEQLDPGRAHLGRTQLLRSVEVALLLGRRLSDLHEERRQPALAAVRYLVVDPGRHLGERIASRARTMLQGGWIEEVARLATSVPDDAIAWKGSGYRSVLKLVRGEIGEDEALDEIVIATRQYAKRQRTWFRNQLPPDRVTQLDPLADHWQQKVMTWFDSIPGGAVV